MTTDSRILGRCHGCDGPVYDAGEWTRTDDGLLFCAWCSPEDPDPTPLQDVTHDRV
jgi:hypothetical protein